MTKADIVNEIAKKTGIEKVTVQRTVEEFMDSVKDSMVDGNNVYLRGFGSFIVKKRAKKTARNISKNTTIIIPEHFIPAFKPSKSFKSMPSGKKRKRHKMATHKRKKRLRKNRHKKKK
jgi:DNA-binding protein HU-beta